MPFVIQHISNKFFEALSIYYSVIKEKFFYVGWQLIKRKKQIEKAMIDLKRCNPSVDLAQDIQNSHSWDPNIVGDKILMMKKFYGCEKGIKFH